MSRTQSAVWQIVRYPLVLAVVCGLSGLLLGYVYGKTKEDIQRGRQSKLLGALGELVPGFKDFETRPGPEAGEFTYKVTGAGGEVLAYAAQTAGKNSYNTMKPIKVVTAMDAGRTKLLGIRVIESEETPGLGERIKDRRQPNTLWGMLIGRPDRRLVLLASGEVSEFAVLALDAQKSEVTVEGADGKVQVLTGARVVEFPPTFQAQFAGLKPGEVGLKKAGGAVDAITGATISSGAVVSAVQRAIEILGN